MKNNKRRQVHVTDGGRERYVRKGRMYVELRTFQELLKPITKIKITQRENDITKCIVYFKDRNHLHLEGVSRESSYVG